MDYRLVVLTHGDNATLARTLMSFLRHARPKPAHMVLVHDGMDLDFVRVGNAPAAITDHLDVVTTSGPLGFCGATARAWEHAVAPGSEYVFWLEHDFVFTRNVDLAVIAEVLDANPALAQMALLRQPVNSDEIAAGGYLKQRPNYYTPRTTAVPMFDLEDAWEEEMPWWEHRSYWTTNPSLFRREPLEARTWPLAAQCEGLFGAQLLADRPDTSFGVWGDGQPWIEHIGKRDGFGY